MPISDTIAAIATARGRAALAIVRLSGPEALQVAAARFRGRDLQEAGSHTAHFGYLLAEDGTEIDQVVATVFRAPRSATGEDVVEVGAPAGRQVRHREVGVDERLPEPARALLPWNQQVLGEEGGDDHAHAVVHPAGRPQLPHPGVHDRIAGPSSLPALQCVVVRSPAEAPELVPQRCVREVAVVIEDVSRKLAPSELAQESIGSLPHSAILHPVLYGVPHLTRTYLAVMQVG